MNRWPFWRTLLDNAQMILAKADMVTLVFMRIWFRKNPSAIRFFGEIEREYETTVEWVLKITQQSELLERTPVLQHSIQRRNPYVDPSASFKLVLLRLFAIRRRATSRTIDRRPREH